MMQIDTVYNKIRNGHRVVITLHHDDELFRKLKNQGIHGLYSAARWYCGYVCSSLPSQGRDVSDKLDVVAYGGITYQGPCPVDDGTGKKLFYYGFDTAHYNLDLTLTDVIKYCDVMIALINEWGDKYAA